MMTTAFVANTSDERIRSPMFMDQFRTSKWPTSSTYDVTKQKLMVASFVGFVVHISDQSHENGHGHGKCWD